MLSLEQKHKIIELSKEGIKTPKIAILLGLTVSVVRKWVKVFKKKEIQKRPLVGLQKAQ